MSAPIAKRTLARALGRWMGATALAIAMVGLGIARLRRVARPQFSPVYAIPDTRAVLGRVALVRAGERSGTDLGWSVLCGGREIASVPGLARPTIERRGSSVVVRARGFERAFDGQICR